MKKKMNINRYLTIEWLCIELFNNYLLRYIDDKQLDSNGFDPASFMPLIKALRALNILPDKRTGSYSWSNPTYDLSLEHDSYIISLKAKNDMLLVLTLSIIFTDTLSQINPSLSPEWFITHYYVKITDHHSYVKNLLIIDLSDSLSGVETSSVLLKLGKHIGTDNPIYYLIESYLDYYSHCSFEPMVSYEEDREYMIFLGEHLEYINKNIHDVLKLGPSQLLTNILHHLWLSDLDAEIWKVFPGLAFTRHVHEIIFYNLSYNLYEDITKLLEKQNLKKYTSKLIGAGDPPAECICGSLQIKQCRHTIF